MTTQQIIRAWKDPAFRSDLTDAKLDVLPAHPSGGNFKELDEAERQRVVGAVAPCCHDPYTNPTTSMRLSTRTPCST